MSSLLKSRENFKKRIAAQPVLQRVKIPANTANDDSALSNVSPAFVPGPVEAVDPNAPRKKLKKSAVVYSQPKDSSTGGQHMLSKFLEIRTWLKGKEEPQTLDDIERGCGIHVKGNADLLQQLRSNPRTTYNPENETYQYKHQYDIRNDEDLLAFMEENRDECVLLETLKDSHVADKLEESVESLVTAGQILVIRKKNMTPLVMFYNDTTYNTAMDKHFRELWHSLKIPELSELPTELEKLGIKTLDTFSEKTGVTAKPKKSKSRSRKVKITNTHLRGIDLTQDYIPGKQ